MLQNLPEELIQIIFEYMLELKCKFKPISIISKEFRKKYAQKIFSKLFVKIKYVRKISLKYNIIVRNVYIEDGWQNSSKYIDDVSQIRELREDNENIKSAYGFPNLKLLVANYAENINIDKLPKSLLWLEISNVATRVSNLPPNLFYLKIGAFSPGSKLHDNILELNIMKYRNRSDAYKIDLPKSLIKLFTCDANINLNTIPKSILKMQLYAFDRPGIDLSYLINLEDLFINCSSCTTIRALPQSLLSFRIKGESKIEQKQILSNLRFLQCDNIKHIDNFEAPNLEEITIEQGDKMLTIQQPNKKIKLEDII